MWAEFIPLAEPVRAVRLTDDNIDAVADEVALHEGNDFVARGPGRFTLRGEVYRVGDWVVDRGDEGWPEYWRVDDAAMRAGYVRVEGGVE